MNGFKRQLNWVILAVGRKYSEWWTRAEKRDRLGCKLNQGGGGLEQSGWSGNDHLGAHVQNMLKIMAMAFVKIRDME